MIRAAAGLPVLALPPAACGPLPDPPPGAAAPAAAARLVPDAAGIEGAGSPQRADFGRAEDGAVAAVTAVIGPSLPGRGRP